VDVNVDVNGGTVDSVSGAVAVVTGGASGIGLALAQRLARDGASVVVADIEEGALERALNVLPEGSLAVPTDVSDAQQVEDLARAVLDRFGRVDVVCNNAGITTFNLLEHQTLDDWRWVFDVNLWGVVNGVRTFVPIMREQGTPGHVVNTASAAGLTGAVPYMAPYAASKAAVIALSETLRAELEMAGVPIGVSVLCPGFTDTNVLEGHRNRGSDRGVEQRTSESEEVVQFIRDSFASSIGKSPEAVADIVLDAVLEDRFWIISHGGMDDIFEARFAAIAAASPPR
jgi:NAD(P)-dependent dehydrogenase (short-subunit alcohol dehydrogenase family)